MRRNLLSVVLGLLLIGWATYHVVTHRHELPSLSQFSWERLTLLVVVAHVFLLFQGAIIREVLLPHKIRLSFREWYGTLHVTLMGNYIFPFAGVGFRAKYLKKVYGLSYADFTSTLAIMYPVQVSVFASAGVAALLGSGSRAADPLLSLLMPLIAVSPLFLILVGPRLPGSGRWSLLRSIVGQWRQVLGDTRFTVRLVTFATGMVVTYSAVFYLTCATLDLTVTPVEAVLLTSVATVMSFIKIAPASLGTYDAAVVYVAHLYGATTTEGLLVAGVVRLCLMASFFLLGPVFGYLLTRDMLRERTS